MVALNIHFNVAVITFIAMGNTNENVSWQKKLYPVNAALAGHENHGYRGTLKKQANNHNIVLIILVLGAVSGFSLSAGSRLKNRLLGGLNRLLFGEIE